MGEPAIHKRDIFSSHDPYSSLGPVSSLEHLLEQMQTLKIYPKSEVLKVFITIFIKDYLMKKIAIWAYSKYHERVADSHIGYVRALLAVYSSTGPDGPFNNDILSSAEAGKVVIREYIFEAMMDPKTSARELMMFARFRKYTVAFIPYDRKFYEHVIPVLLKSLVDYQDFPNYRKNGKIPIEES